MALRRDVDDKRSNVVVVLPSHHAPTPSVIWGRADKGDFANVSREPRLHALKSKLLNVQKIQKQIGVGRSTVRPDDCSPRLVNFQNIVRVRVVGHPNNTASTRPYSFVQQFSSAKTSSLNDI